MALATSVILSFLVALLRGGKISALASLRFRGLHYLAVSIVVRILLALPPLQDIFLKPAIGDMRYGGLLYSLSLLMAMLALLSNLPLPGLKAVTLGLASNFLVILANLGQMPVAPDKLLAAGVTAPPAGRWSHATIMDESARLSFLADNLLVGLPWPRPFIISPGDVLIVVGVFWFFQKVMK